MFKRVFPKRALFFSGVLGLLYCCTAAAQMSNQGLIQTMPATTRQAPVLSEADMQRSLELSSGFQNLSGGFGSWRDVTLRGAYGLPSHLLQAEVSAIRRFNKDGSFIGLSNTYTFNEDWYSSLALGFGDGAFYLPRYRADATLYRKLLSDRSLVSSIGLGYYKAPDGHTDSAVSLGLTYYFASPWIAEGGVRFNSSNPGSIKTQQQFVALTYGRVKQDLVTVRYASGGEGYQTIGPATNQQLVNFKSSEASVSWRHWFAPRTGFLIGANQYTNPSYNRSGLNIGIFHDY